MVAEKPSLRASRQTDVAIRTFDTTVEAETDSHVASLLGMTELVIFLCYSLGSVSSVFAFFRFRENFFPPLLRRTMRTTTTITAAITSNHTQL